MAELSKEQLFLLDQFQDDIDFFKAKLNTQIRNSKILMGVGIGLAVVFGIIIFTVPGLRAELSKISEHMGTVATTVVEALPVTLSAKSFNSKKTLSKKLDGVRVYEKDLERMRVGIIPNSNNDIMALEKEFVRYITT